MDPIEFFSRIFLFLEALSDIFGISDADTKLLLCILCIIAGAVRVGAVN